MLTNTIGILKEASEKGYAIPQFNINNLEWTKYILEECQALNNPVILGVSEGAVKYMGGYNVVFSLVESLIKDLNITIPVVLHLDHGSSFDSCKKAIDVGFTSVMIDASKLPLEENIKLTKEVIEYARPKNVSVEAEIGKVGGQEDGTIAETAYANVNECLELVDQTKVDCFAPALGSVHGYYIGEPKLDFDRMQQLKELCHTPLVLHGGTGIPDDMVRKAISCGMAKININTELQNAWTNAVREYLSDNKNVYDPRKVIGSGENALKEAIRNKIKLFSNKV